MQEIAKKTNKNSKGLSIIEMLVAIFVFAVTISTSMAVAATYLRGSFAIKEYQENSEELSLALNYVSKDIRMSNSLNAGSGKVSKIELINNTDNISLEYVFDGNNFKRAGQIIANDVSGSFYVRNNSGIPLITMAIWKNNHPEFSAETTVSMRSGYK